MEKEAGEGLDDASANPMQIDRRGVIKEDKINRHVTGFSPALCISNAPAWSFMFCYLTSIRPSSTRTTASAKSMRAGLWAT